MFVKLTSGFTGRPLISRNLVLQELWRTGSKSYKLEVTFAIHPIHLYYTIGSTQKQYNSPFCEVKLQISQSIFRYATPFRMA